MLIISRLFVTGDIHGSTSIRKLNKSNFLEGQNLTKDDTVIILGDFGLLWDNSNQDKYWLDWLEAREWTTMFIDGNHENFNLIDKLEMVEYMGNMVGKVRNSVFHIPRGTVLEIDNKLLYCFGGAESTDREFRIEGKDWWKDELPTHTEMNRGIINLEAVNYCVDYVLTHTCPLEVLGQKSTVNGILVTIIKICILGII